METSAKGRVIYFDIIRIIACFFVIVVHVSSNQLLNLAPSSFDFQVSQFFNTLALTAPAIFLMLSGAIFLNPGAGDIPIKKLWGRYILRMAVAYVFWSCLHTFIIWLPYYTFSLETVKAYILEFFYGKPMYHMWFIPAIISIYMVLPLLRPAFADKQRCKYYLCLLAVVQFLVPTIQKFNLPHMDLLQIVYSRIPYVLCISYVGYFVLGYYLSVEEFSRKMRIVIYSLGILGLMAAVGINGYLSVSENTATLLLDDIFTLNCFFFAAAVFVAFRYTPWKAEKYAKAIAALSKLTFGIYLIHPLFMDMFFKHCTFLLNLPAIIWIPAVSAVTFLSSMATIWVISKIPVANKYLI